MGGGILELLMGGGILELPPMPILLLLLPMGAPMPPPMGDDDMEFIPGVGLLLPGVKAPAPVAAVGD